MEGMKERAYAMKYKAARAHWSVWWCGKSLGRLWRARSLCSVYVSVRTGLRGDVDENWLRAETELLKSSSSGLVSSPIKKKRRIWSMAAHHSVHLLGY